MTKKTIWVVVLLIGGYVMCQAVADVAATKLVHIGSMVIPAGTFVFTITFTLRDLIHKRLGKQWARTVIIAAGIFNLFMAGYLALMTYLPAPPFFALGDSWNAIFSLVPAITLGSITAEVVSELLDTEVYHWWKTRIETRLHSPQWARVLVSNAIPLPVDSVVFAFTAFVFFPMLFGQEALPFSVAWSLVAGQIVWKAAVTVISMPLIYAVTIRAIRSGHMTAGRITAATIPAIL